MFGINGIRIVGSLSIIVSLGWTWLWLFAVSHVLDLNFLLLALFSFVLILVGSILLMKSNPWGLLLFSAGVWGLMFWNFYMIGPTLPGEEFNPILNIITSPSTAVWIFFLGSLIYFFIKFGFKRYLLILLILMFASFTIYFYVSTGNMRLNKKASNPATSADELRTLYRRSLSLDWFKGGPIQLNLAENPNTPIDILQVLSADPNDYHAAAAVADNPSATKEILLRLYNDKDSWPYVRRKAAKRLNIPFPELKIITGPPPNSQVSGTVTIAWQTINALPNSRVELWIEGNREENDQLKVNNGSPNGSYVWDTTETPNGHWAILVDLFDVSSTYLDGTGFEVEVINN